MARKLTTYGSRSDNSFNLRTMSGNPAGTDAFNTLMQVLRSRRETPDGVLIFDEGTWDDFVWA